MKKRNLTALQIRCLERRKELSEKTGYRLLRILQRKYFSNPCPVSYSKEEVIKDLGECIAEGMDFELIGMVVWYMNTSCDELNEATWKSRRRGFKNITKREKV